MPRFPHIIILIALLASSAAAQRGAWTTPRVTGSPDPPAPCAVERVFPAVIFSEPIEIVAFPGVPGSNRLAIAQRGGKLFTLTPESKQPDLFADLRQFNDEIRECYSFAFHPRFAENRFVFIWANLDGKGKPNREDGTHIIRFKVAAPGTGAAANDPPRLDLASGKTILTFVSGGHNGGALRFGPDGMLYISIGDGEVPEPPDPRITGQDISDLSASILRLDVDHEDGKLAYRVPPDNPFVKLPAAPGAPGAPGARGEVWAYGFRNPWRIAFDPFTGRLFAGDVGWELWEGIFRVERGGNYGWSITEMSRQPVRPDRKRGPTPILPPAAAHSHEEAMSITGGEVYRGKKLPDLHGSYIYGDWETGRIWSLRMQGESPEPPQELCDTTLKIISFGVDHDGEMLILDFVGGGIHRLIANPEQRKPGKFPRRLSETGLFADVKKHEPAPGVLPYEVRAPRWADHAKGERLLALPGMAKITNAKKEDGILPAGRWVLPKDGVLAKTYSLEMERGKPETARRIETQMMHWNGQTWNAYTYKWNDAQTDAELVGSGGDEQTFEITDASAPGGGKRKQTWRFHSRAECQRCHNAWVNYMPGFNKLQLDTSDANKAALPQSYIEEKLPRESVLVDPHDATKPLESRARSYLHANCGACHRFGGGGAVPMVLNIETKLSEARLINVKPTQGTMGLEEARVVASNDACRSVLIYRMATTGRGHMPYVGSKLVDARGLSLIRRWISTMPAEKEMPEALREQPWTDAASIFLLKPNEDSAFDALLRTSHGALSLALAIGDGYLPTQVEEKAIQRGAALTDLIRRDLFERFLPDEKRRATLGDRLDVKSLLAIKGNSDRGKALFFAQGGAQCAACHRIAAEGVEFGPDLTKIADKYKREELLDHILAPSKKIDDAWKLVLIETTDGETYTGFILRKTETELALRIPGGKEARIAIKLIASQRTQNLSAMPEGLLRSLTAQEAADLLDYLTSLK